MAFGKCTNGHIIQYRAVKGSRLSYIDCPICGNQDGLKRATWEEYNEAPDDMKVDIRYRE